jgi:hypothetical protein
LISQLWAAYSCQLGNGDGTFQAPTAPFPVSSHASVIAAADLNGDGRLDLVVEQDPTVLQIYLQNSDGTFSNIHSYVMTIPSLYFGLASSTGIVIADFNHDGKPDVAGEGGVLLGNGDGSFQGIPLGSIPGTVAPGLAVVGNFENNSRMDAAAVSGASYTFSVTTVRAICPCCTHLKFSNPAES